MNNFKITSESIDKVNYVINNMNGNSFHNHYHILYDICNSLQSQSTYVEIGTYAGGSASLISMNKNISKVISIDIGHPIPKQIPIENVNKFKHESCTYNYIQGSSRDDSTLNQLCDLVDNIDVLFIDGDHTQQGVFNDFLKYKHLVKSGGYIVFDDYLDFKYSPEVYGAVNHIVKHMLNDEYDVIGSLSYPELKLTNSVKDSSNEYIIRKK